jgi:hypothetical protein
MHLSTYTALFRDLATRHVAIQATPENKRFLRMLISFDPVQKQLDLTEFYGNLRSGIKARGNQPLLVVENYQTDYDDNKGDYLTRRIDGAFLVLQYCKVDDYDARDEAISTCEVIAEELLAALIYKLNEGHNIYLSAGDAWAEHLGPIADGYCGVRMNFSWKEGASQDLYYNPAKFSE